MRERIHREVFFACSMLLAFFMPLIPKFLPVIITVMIVNWLAGGTWLRTIPLLFSEKWRLKTLLLSSLYLFYLAGMLWSTDYSYGWFDLEVKLSLLIFPVILSTGDPDCLSGDKLRRLFGAFIAGCVAGSLMLLIHTWAVHERWGVKDAYYYTNLAWYFHSSYLAMYYNFGAGVALYYMDARFTGRSLPKNLGLVLLVVYLEAFIFLLSSKAGLMSLVMTQALFLLLMIRNKAGAWRIVAAAAVMAAVFVLFFDIFPFAFKRISRADSMVKSEQKIQDNPNDGTLARMEIWKVSWNLVRQHIVAGVGTGDVKDALMDSYREHKLYPVLKKKLNAHNQYIQTSVALGLFGLGILLATLIWPALISLRKGWYLYTLFILVFALNILFESMLETQAGVVFFGFFNSMMFCLMAARISVRLP